MATFFALFAAAVLAAAPLTPQRVPPPKPDSSFLVGNGRAGVFEIGMTVDEAQAIAGVKNTKVVASYGEGMFQPELEISLTGFAKGAAILAPISDFPCGIPSLRGLIVHDPRFKTSRGIGIGSSLADIRKYQPSAKIVNFGADGFPVVIDEETGVSFAFEGAIESNDRERVTLLWLHSGSRVKSRRCPDDDDRAAVYQEVLSNVVRSRHAGSEPIIVMAETKHMCDAAPLKPLDGVGCLQRQGMTAPFLTGKLAESFFGHNSGRYQVPMLDGVTALVPSAGLPRLFPPDVRRLTVTFSSPGFDNGRAAIFVSYSCGNVCGEGLLVLLELTNDKWKVAAVRMYSVSVPASQSQLLPEHLKWLK